MLWSSGPQPFLAPGTGFMEDNFSTDRRWGGGGVQAVTRAWGAADEASLACSPATHLLLCVPDPNRPPAGGCGPREHRPLNHRLSHQAVGGAAL